jgi:hypothetical protein
MCENLNVLDGILIVANFLSKFRNTVVYFEVAEIEVQLKQRAVTGVLLTEGQKPT